MATVHARMPENTPVNMPNTNTMSQMLHLDSIARASGEPVANVIHRTVDVFINNVNLPLVIDVNSFRRALGLPEHNLLAEGIFNSPSSSSVPSDEQPAFPDLDHMSSQSSSSEAASRE